MVMGLNWQGCRLFRLGIVLTVVLTAGCASFGEEPEDAFENPNDMMPGPGLFSGEDGVVKVFGDNSDSGFGRNRSRQEGDWEAGYNDTTQLPDESDAEGGW